MELPNQKNQYAKMVSLFLAELLRTRKIDLSRAADIAQKVIRNINLIDTEEQFLNFVKELTRDFDELFPLEERVHMHVHVTKRKDLEQKVQAFVIDVMAKDIDTALHLLQSAIDDEAQLEDLFVKFPDFKLFVQNNPQLWTKIH